MSIQLRLFLTLLVIIYFVLIFRFIKSKYLVLKYSLLWIVLGIIFGLLILIPDILNLVVMVLGMQLGANALFLLGIGVTLIIVMSLTIIVSKQTEKIRELVQDNAMLEKRIRELEKKL